MAKTSSVSQSPQEAQLRADQVRDGLCMAGVYPKNGAFPDNDGAPQAYLAELAPTLSYDDAVALWLAADLLIRSPEPGYWQRRQARIDALMTEPLPTPTQKEIQSVKNFLAALAGEAS